MTACRKDSEKGNTIRLHTSLEHCIKHMNCILGKPEVCVGRNHGRQRNDIWIVDHGEYLCCLLNKTVLTICHDQSVGHLQKPLQPPLYSVSMNLSSLIRRRHVGA
uniref:Uncharacterized protein n=1 Tax=Arundo donax TaxID=35708 RepID=A0A0A9HDK1_ARUDO